MASCRLEGEGGLVSSPESNSCDIGECVFNAGLSLDSPSPSVLIRVDGTGTCAL